MMIMKTALMEKIRRKELYVIGVVGLLVVLLFSSGNSSISVGGEPITGYSNLIKVLITVVNAVCGALAIALSIGTIPKEYERSTSHLILVRGISQTRYHGELALANVIGSCMAGLIMYIGIAVFSLTRGEGAAVIRLIPAYLIVCISIAFVSLLTSALTIKLPGLISGMIAVVFFLIGICHGILEMLGGMIGGFAGKVLKGLLWITPDLNGIQKQAANILAGNVLQIHSILKGLLMIYIITVLFIVWRRKEI